MPVWVEQGVQTYQKRLPRHLPLEFREIPAAQRSSGSTPAKIKDREAEQILKAAQGQAYVVALDERGKSWSSQDLAAQLQRWQNEYSSVAFLIGGADGLADACKSRADSCWSLSSLTLPHALVRVVLAEQIYRAWTLVQGHPYHRD